MFGNNTRIPASTIAASHSPDCIDSIAFFKAIALPTQADCMVQLGPTTSIEKDILFDAIVRADPNIPKPCGYIDNNDEDRSPNVIISSII